MDRYPNQQQSVTISISAQPPVFLGYKYLLTLCAVDVLSRWGAAVPLKDLKSATVVAALKERILQPNG